MISLVDEVNQFQFLFLWVKQLQKLFMQTRYEIYEDNPNLTGILLTKKTFRKVLQEGLVVHSNLAVVAFRNEDYNITNIL